MRIRIILLHISLIFYNTLSYGQGAEASMKPISVPSPEVASLMKFVETPVSYFNGIPNISIPLYAINELGISIPITLSYHSNGLKVAEEASWVGLGWSLQAGGTISHVPMGRHDQDCGLTQFERKIGKILPDAEGSDYQNTGSNIHVSAVERSSISSVLLPQLYDPNGELYFVEDMLPMDWINMEGEADLYMYNFHGYSGKFIKINGYYQDLTHNKIRFESGTDYFTAITPNGYKYYFDVVERSRSANVGANNCTTNSSYHLTRIENPNNSEDAIVFSYESFEQLYDPYWHYFEPFEESTTGFQLPTDGTIPQIPGYSGEYVVSSVETGEKRMRSNTFIYPQYLKRIDFASGYIEFKLSARADAYGFKLDEIRIFKSNESEPVKTFRCTYDYFETQEGYGSNYLNLPPTHLYIEIDYPENYLRKRLKLLNVTELSSSYSEGRKHSFEYNEGTLPYKTSFAQDYWGYYNGKETNTSLVPDFRRYLHRFFVPETFINWRGANREPDETSMMPGMLKKITYPTKGWTTYEYESNRYTNLSEYQAVKIESPRVTAVDVNREGDLFNGAYQAGVASEIFTINNISTGGAVADISVSLFCNCSSNACDCEDGQSIFDCFEGYGQNALYAMLQKLNPSTSEYELFEDDHWDISDNEIRDCLAGGGGTYNYSKVLPNGTYRIIANLPDAKSGVSSYLGYPGNKMASISVTYQQMIPHTDPVNDGGGLRVSKIVNFDNEINKANERIFTYEDGIMARFPIFYWKTTKGYWHEGLYNPFIRFSESLYSNSVFPYSYAANGSLVGYRKVTEVFPGNGRVEYRYKMREDQFHYVLPPDTGDFEPHYLPGVPTTSYQDNGNLLTATYYAEESDDFIKKIQNFYSEPLKPSFFWNFKAEVGFPEGKQGNPGGGDPGLAQNYFLESIRLCYYPINIGKVVLEKTVETVDGINHEIEYKYDNAKHFELTRKFQKQSDGSYMVNHLFYPDDFANSTGFIGEMKANNIIDRPIEEIVYQTNDSGGNVRILSGKITTYKTGSKVGLPDQNYFLETTSPIPLTSFKFSNRSSANILPPTGDDFNFSLGGKDPHYPEIENLSYSFDNSGNLNEIVSRGGVVTSYLWGYNSTKPIAIVTNALEKDVYYTSFEEDGSSSYAPVAKSGERVFPTSHVINLSGLTNNTYVVSYWKRESGEWKYYSVNREVTNGTLNYTIAGVSSSSPIDEVRVLPINAQMTTFTYDPVVGLTSQTDANGNSTFFEYDTFGRLKNVIDDKGYINQNYKYHYRE